jgi:hypothetical protein
VPGECKFVPLRELIVYDGGGTVGVLNIGMLCAQRAQTKRSVGSSCRPARMIAETARWIAVLEIVR